jgi:hypothetical protein
MPDLGSAIDWSEDDLDRLSEISQSDIESAQAWWRQHAPARYRRLLDAQPEIDEEIDVVGAPA